MRENNSHDQKCMKYKRKIEDLKLDKEDLLDSIEILKAKIEKLEKKCQKV